VPLTIDDVMASGVIADRGDDRGRHALAGVRRRPAHRQAPEVEAIALYIFDEDEPGKLIGERAYWDNDALLKQMKGEEAPPLIGLAENPRILEHNSVKTIQTRA
jgi:hypothetical protein